MRRGATAPRLYLEIAMCWIFGLVALAIVTLLGGDYVNTAPTQDEEPAAESQEAEGEEAAYPGPY